MLNDHIAQSSEDKLAEKELELIYLKAIETLPPRMKEAYLLRYETQLSTSESANRMKSNPRTIKNQHVKAKKIIIAYIHQNS